MPRYVLFFDKAGAYLCEYTRFMNKWDFAGYCARTGKMLSYVNGRLSLTDPDMGVRQRGKIDVLKKMVPVPEHAVGTPEQLMKWAKEQPDGRIQGV